MFLAQKWNSEINIRRSLYKGPDATEFLIKIILLGVAGFLTKVLVADVLCTMTGPTKSTGSFFGFLLAKP